MNRHDLDTVRAFTLAHPTRFPPHRRPMRDVMWALVGLDRQSAKALRSLATHVWVDTALRRKIRPLTDIETAGHRAADRMLNDFDLAERTTR